MDLLAKGSLWLAEQQEKYCSSDIMYQHDGRQHDIHATYGTTDYEVADEYGVKIRAHGIDFLIRVTLLPFDPEPGDRIMVNTDEYEVMPLGQSGCWRWCDSFKNIRRIHTKKI